MLRILADQNVQLRKPDLLTHPNLFPFLKLVMKTQIFSARTGGEKN